MEVTELGRRTTERTHALALERRADGRLWAVRGEAERAVWVRRCFPWSAPARLLSLRDDDDTEFALVRDPGELDAASRLVLEEALVAAGFVFEVTRVTAIDLKDLGNPGSFAPPPTDTALRAGMVKQAADEVPEDGGNDGGPAA